MRVLVVEDEPIIAINIQATLLDLGYRPVGPAATISEAMSLIEQRKFDAAILDISLPDGESYDLAETLVERGIAVMFATGRDIETSSLLLADVPVISKPFDLAKLGKCLETLKARVQAGRAQTSPAPQSACA